MIEKKLGKFVIWIPAWEISSKILTFSKRQVMAEILVCVERKHGGPRHTLGEKD